VGRTLSQSSGLESYMRGIGMCLYLKWEEFCMLQNIACSSAMRPRERVGQAFNGGWC
jgi:hypothetical protein